MSGNDIAYHLRQNKAIDRNLFIDLLVRVGRVRNISDYEYIGFGGPLLEDYKALHAALRIKRMHSIERDSNTFRRQKFNCPAKFVKLHLKTSEEFFLHHEFYQKGTVVWLDYTSPGELSDQLQEFRKVVSDLDCFDVVKITLNANFEAIQSKSSKDISIHEARLETLKDTIPAYLPNDLTADDLMGKNYPSTLQRFLQKSVEGLSARASGRYFHILSSFVYKDGQQMLTVTGMVFDAAQDSKMTDFITQSRIRHWPFANLNWAAPTPISVPALSAKERIKLDALLPLRNADSNKTVEKLKRHMGYVPGSEESELVNYARYYRAYPHFSRVIL